MVAFGEGGLCPAVDKYRLMMKHNNNNILEEMDTFNFDDEGTTVRTIIFDSSSDTENDEPDLKSEPLLPTTAEERLLKTQFTTNNSYCQYINAEINKNKAINKHLNDTGQIYILKAKDDYQISNETKVVHTYMDSSKRTNERPDLQDSEPKIQKTNFPRTKITSRRQVKKFPGKMDSMKNMLRVSKQDSQEPVEESLVNSDEINRLSTDSGRRTPESDQNIIAALKIVAENLIKISPYLNKFVRTDRSNVAEFKNISDSFKHAKLHYFALSYSTVASTILPYTKNPKFMQEFYKLTFQLADQKRIPNTFSEKSLQMLCSEMIDWTQIKILQHNNDEISRMSVINNTPSSNSTQFKDVETRSVTYCNIAYTKKKIHESIHGPVESMNTFPHVEPTNNNGDITLVFPAEHINSAIKISYNPALTSQNSIPSLSSTNVNSNMTVHNNMNTNNYPGEPHTQPQRYPQHIQQQQQSPSLKDLLKEKINRNNQHALQQCRQPSAMPSNVIRQNPLSSIKIQSCYQMSQPPQTKKYSGSNNPNMFEPHHSSPCSQTYIPPQKALSFGEQQLNEMDQSKPNQQRNFIKLNNYPQERSTSRDSGFFSPVQDTYHQDCPISPMGVAPSQLGLPPPPTYPCSFYQQPPIESSAIPSTLPYGDCFVCKRLTNLTCLGCSNTYYCCDTCQNIDWMYHKEYCRST